MNAEMFKECLDSLPDGIQVYSSSNNLLFQNTCFSTDTTSDTSSYEIQNIKLEKTNATLHIQRQKQETIIHNVLDLLPHIAWVTDTHGLCRFTNIKTCTYSGIQVQNLLSSNWATLLLHPDDKIRTYNAWINSIRDHVPFDIEYRLRAKDGSYRWFKGSAGGIEGKDGVVEMWIGTCIDIHESKVIEGNLRRTENRMRKERRLFETTLGQLPVAVMVGRGPDGKIVYHNDKVEEVWKHPMKETNCIEEYGEWVGFHKDGRRYVGTDWPLARSLMYGEVVVNEDTDVIFGDGTRGIVRLSSKPLYADDGSIELGIVICEDVTERVKMEELRVELLTREKTAFESCKLKSEFLANMSHEIRTPLHGVIGMAEYLVDDLQLTSQQRDVVTTIKESGKLLLTVINDILDFSKIEAGKVELENVPFDLKKTFLNVESLMGPVARKKGISLSFEFEDPLPGVIIGDPQRIKQILLNLTDNAVKFTNEGEVCVNVSGIVNADHVQLKIQVADTGIGISSEHMKHLFQPFTQADTSTTRRYGGTGLGLTISKLYVELMRGEINLCSEIGKGTVFTVNIPFKIGSTIAPSIQTKSVPTSFNKIRVLLVEDNPVNQKVAVRAFHKHGITNLDILENGRLALEKFEKNTYDIVFMDCQMPVLDGYETTRMIRKLERESGRARIPIVALTASALKTDQEACFSAGMDSHIAKPFSSDQLKAKLLQYIHLPRNNNKNLGVHT